MLRDDGKWRVYRSRHSQAWLVIRGTDILLRIRRFDTHAEALAYAIKQAEVGR